MSKFTLPPKKTDAETLIKKVPVAVNEKKITDVILKGGSVTRSDNSWKEDIFKNFNVKILESELQTINELREKLPKPRGKRLGISLHDWIIAAIQEKIVRDSKK